MLEQNVQNVRYVPPGAKAAEERYLARQESPKKSSGVSFGGVKTLFQNLRQRFAKKERIESNGSQNILGQAREFFSAKRKRIGIGIVILVVAVGGYFLISNLDIPTVAISSVPVVIETPPTVTLHPVDIKSVSFVGSTLILMLIALVALFPLGILDGKERLQVSDVTVAIVGFFLNYIVVWKPFVAFWTTLIPVFTEQLTAITFGILITGIVITKSLTGGRDTTNLGIYFGMLAIAGAISQNMGAFQIAFGLPSQPVYLLQDLPNAIMALQLNTIRYSLLVYFVLFLAIGSYALDVFYPKEKEIRWEAVATAMITIGIFYLARIKFEVEYAMLFGITAGVLLAVITRKTGTQGNNTEGENALTNIVKRVFDYTAWDGVGMGVILIVFLRLTGLA